MLLQPLILRTRSVLLVRGTSVSDRCARRETKARSPDAPRLASGVTSCALYLHCSGVRLYDVSAARRAADPHRSRC